MSTSQYEMLPGFIRPQQGVDDLIAEYEAWVAGERDGHDQVVEDCKVRMLQRSEGAHEFALKYLQPEFACSHGKCDCVKPGAVLAQLEGRLAVARGRRAAYEDLVKTLERVIEQHKERSAQTPEVGG